MSSLDDLRNELASINKTLLDLMMRRRKVAALIQDEKSDLNLKKYDPQREASLFFSLKDELDSLSLRELEAFSLLMEDHAGEGYPRWSEGQHLVDPRVGLHVNPLLILLFQPSVFNLNDLKTEYGQLVELARAHKA